MRRLLLLALVIASAAAVESQPVPVGTEVTTDYRTEGRHPPEHLIDGDVKTHIGGAGGSGVRSPLCVFLKFPEALPQLAGVVTGDSDYNHNYYPLELDLWLDTTGDNRFDTFAGSVTGLGAGAESAGDRVFAQPIANVHALCMRVTKQSQKGLKRAFIMNELRLIADAGGSAATVAAEPLSAKPVPQLRAKPKPIVADMSELMPLNPGGWNVVNANKNKHGGNMTDIEGRDDKVFNATWKPGAKPFIEIAARGRPWLAGYQAGVGLELDLNVDGCPGLRAFAVRAVDAAGETWHFGGQLPEEGSGWQTVRLTLDPASSKTSSYGGPQDRSGLVDAPLRLSTVCFAAPDKSDEQRSIFIGKLRRNAVPEGAREPALDLMAVKAELRVDGPLATVTASGRDQAAVVLSLGDGDPALNCGVALRFIDDAGRDREVVHEGLSIAAGGSVVVPFGEQLDRFGWYQVTAIVLTADGSGRVPKKAMPFCYIDPVGTRELRPDDFLFGMDIRFGDPKRDMALADGAAQVGVDIVREGVTWSNVEKSQGQYDWDKHDFWIKALNERQILAQYAFTFSPAWAVDSKWVEILKKAKQPSWKMAMCPPRPDAFRAYVRTVAQRIKDQEMGVDYFEMWNEPDLEGFWKGSTDEYLALQRIANEELKAVLPDAHMMTGGIATVGAHGGHGLNPDLIKRSIVESQDVYDVINLHFHGPFGNFVPQIDGRIESYQQEMKQRKPLFFNETGAGAGKDKRVWQASELVKKFSFAKLRGGVGFNWFALYFRGEHQYSMLDHGYKPYPVYPAFNAMTHMLRDVDAGEQAELPAGYWLIAFEGSDRQVFVGWDQDAAVSGQRVPVVIPDGAAATWYDVMGNPLGTPVNDGLLWWALDKPVRYLEVRGGTARVAKPLAAFLEEPYGEPGKEITVQAQLSNPIDRAVSATVTWTQLDGSELQQQHQLPARGQATAELPIVMPVGGSTASVIGLAYSFDTGWTGSLSLPLHAAVRIPSAAIASREADFIAEGEAQIFNNNHADPTRAQWAWKGNDDISAHVWWALADGYLDLRIDVKDDKHMQPNDAKNTWKADGIQLAISIPGRGGLWQLGFARNDAGKDLVVQWNAPVGVPSGYDKTIQFSTEDLPGGLRYQARLPVKGFGADANFLRSKAIAFNLIVNDEDGGGREGWAFVAEGMGKGKNQVELWPLISFE
ncbi:MAG: hypothetical protein PF961_07665 [Planctomycetota bacterium]|jgi:hypothetical protein|nr:hypothetical protein [Planctomycetota bacterium]